MSTRKTDSEIEQWVLRELSLENKILSPEICVQSHDGVITLCGSVPNYTNKTAAEQAAYRVAGVADVVNRIQVKPCTALIRRSLTTMALPPPFKQTPLFRPIKPNFELSSERSGICVARAITER